jgi:hypothetical protein
MSRPAWRVAALAALGACAGPRGVEPDTASSLHTDTGANPDTQDTGCAAPSWEVVPLAAASYWVQDVNLLVDAAGDVDIAFGDSGQQLAHAGNGSGSWIVQDVDPTTINGFGPGLDAAMAYTPEGDVRIGYMSWNELRHARGRQESWAVETVAETSVYFLLSASLALDGGGNAHLVGTHDDVVYVSDASGAWATEVLEVGRHAVAEIVIDAGGTPHVLFEDISTHELFHAVRSTGWVTTSLGILAAEGASAVETSGDVRVALVDGGGTLRLGVFTGAVWSYEVVATGVDGTAPALAVDDAGGVAIAFVTAAGELSIATRGPEGYAVTPIETSSDDEFAALSLVAGPDGFHLLYEASFHAAARHAWFDGAAWRVETFDALTFPGLGRYATAMDAEGGLHTAYVDFGVDELRYAYRSPGTCAD